MHGHFAFLCIGALLSGCWGCTQTPEEENLAKYVAHRAKLTSDGTIARQIKAGTYTADSLNLEMYTWWVQLGLANHGAAIDSFVNMFQDAGMKQQTAPAKEWTKIVKEWALPMVMISSMLDPRVKPLFMILQAAIASWETVAMALADPKQGGSTNFMKVAQKYRAYLPNRHTKSLLMIHEFITDLKTHDTTERLLPAYELVTSLIKSAQSYRFIFNQYYVHYLRSTVPHNGFVFASNVRQGFLAWLGFFKPHVSHAALWTPTPVALKGCVVVQSVMEANHGCIDPSTPVLGSLGFKALVATKFFFGNWRALEYSCADLNATKFTGCYERSGKRHDAEDVSAKGERVCESYYKKTIGLVAGTDTFLWLSDACEKALNPSSSVAAYNWIPGVDHYPWHRLANRGSIHKHTCAPKRLTIDTGNVSAATDPVGTPAPEAGITIV